MMKQYLVMLALMLTLHAGAASVRPKSTQRAAVEAVDTTKAAIEAYSDTTEAALSDSADTAYATHHSSYTWEPNTPAEEFFAKLLGGTIGVGGAVIAIIVALGVLLCVLAPFIVLLFLIRYLINRQNNRVKLAQKAMETGQPMPTDMLPETTESPEYYRKKGIKNIAIGVGIVLLFTLWDMEMLAGIGVLITCWGIGQLVIAKTTK